MQLFTLEIRSAEGELYFLRARVAEHLQFMLGNKILPAKGFAEGGYKIIIRPYNEATDQEDIGDLTFLGERIEPTFKAGDKVWYVDFAAGKIEAGKLHSVCFKNGRLDCFSVDFGCGDFSGFEGAAMGGCIFTSEDAVRDALLHGG